MGFTHTFTAAGPDLPYWPAVYDTLRAQDDTAGFDPPAGLTVTITKGSAWTAAQVTFAQNAIDAAPRDSDQIRAQFEVDNISLFDKALVLVLIDQLNVLRALHGLAAITPAQAIAALRAKAGSLT